MKLSFSKKAPDLYKNADTDFIDRQTGLLPPLDERSALTKAWHSTLTTTKRVSLALLGSGAAFVIVAAGSMVGTMEGNKMDRELEKLEQSMKRGVVPRQPNIKPAPIKPKHDNREIQASNAGEQLSVEAKSLDV